MVLKMNYNHNNLKNLNYIKNLINNIHLNTLTMLMKMQILKRKNQMLMYKKNLKNNNQLKKVK